MQAIIIAGGKGTRLRPLTYGTPKPMLPLIDRPFLEWMVERCVAAKITDILVNVHYQADQVRDFFGDGSPWGAKMRYIEETTALDTAGAITLARPLLTGEPLLVFNADILTDLDLGALMKFHNTQGAAVTITLTRVEDITPFGLVELDHNGKVLAFREKPTITQAQTFIEKGINTINAGTYVIDPQLFQGYAVGAPLSFERVFFPEMLAQGHSVLGFVWAGYWMDVGNPHKYYQAQLDILAGKVPYEFHGNSPQPGIWIAPNATIDVGAQLLPPCYIGQRSVLGKNARIPGGTLVGNHALIDAPIVPGIYADGTMVLS